MNHEASGVTAGGGEIFANLMEERVLKEKNGNGEEKKENLRREGGKFENGRMKS